MADVVALTKKYFEVWNAHDVEGIQARALFLSLSPSLSLYLSLARALSLSLCLSLSVYLSGAPSLSLSRTLSRFRLPSLSLAPPRSPPLALPRSPSLSLALPRLALSRSPSLSRALPRSPSLARALSRALSRSLSLSRARLALSVLARALSSRPLPILARSLPLLALSLGAFSPRSPSPPRPPASVSFSLALSVRDCSSCLPARVPGCRVCASSLRRPRLASQALHAPASKLKDWDAEHGPTNADVAKGIGGIWKAVPAIKIEIVDVYTCGPSLTCVANIKVIVDATTTLKVCDVIEYDASGKVVSLNAYKAD